MSEYMQKCLPHLRKKWFPNLRKNVYRICAKMFTEFAQNCFPDFRDANEPKRVVLPKIDNVPMITKT
jgi:hypothetical protein